MRSFIKIFCFSLAISGLQAQISESTSTLIDSLETLTGNKQLDLLKIISYQLTKENPDSSIYYSILGLRLSNEQGAINYIGPFQQRLGIAYRIKGNYLTAIELYKNAEKIFSEIGDENGLAVTYNSLGILFLLTKNHELAILYFEKVLEFDLRTSYYYGVISDYNNLAGVYLELNELEKVKACYVEALKIVGEQNISSLAPTLWNNIGDYQILISNPDSAMSCYYKSTQLAPDPRTYMHSAMGIGDILMDKNADSSKYFLKTAYDLAAKLDDQYVLADAALLLSQFHSNQNQYDTALAYAQEYQKFREHLLQAEQLAKINEIEIKYETEKKELQIKNQKKQIVLSYTLAAAAILTLFLIINRLLIQRKVDRLSREKFKIEVDHKNRLLASRTMDISNYGIILEDLNNKILEVEKNKSLNLAEVLKKSIKQKKRDIGDWEQVKIHFEEVHPQFFDNISKLDLPLTSNEQKHCAYIKMKIGNKDIARMMNVNLSSVHVVHHRLKKKLGLRENDSLPEYIHRI
jgi:tetratricopeptide (TPR) repeat protein